MATVLSLLLSSTFITLQSHGEIDVFNRQFGDESRTVWMVGGPYIQDRETHMDEITKGYYSASSMYGLEPGRYTVNVEPVGINITLYLKDGENTVMKRFNGSTNFKTEINTNTVWVGIIIMDPITFQEHTGEFFIVDFVKENEVPSTVFIMWGLTTAGVIYLGFDTYSRKRN